MSSDKEAHRFQVNLPARGISRSIPVVEIDEPAGSVLRQLASYWQELATGRDGQPARADLDLVALKPHLSRISLLDAIDDGDDFRIRLVGTGVVDLFGRDLTGHRMREAVTGPGADKMLAFLRMALHRGGPVFAAASIAWQEKRDWMRFEAVLLPLYRNGAPNMLMLGHDW